LEKTINRRQSGKKQWIGRQPFKTMTMRKPWIKTMDRETTLWNNDKEKTLDKNNG
jgi:hypothetical protein